MFLDSRELIDDTIDRLEKITELLAHEFGERQELTPEARTCKEAVQTIKVLIPKLHRARAAQVADSQSSLPGCPHCD